jgi:hypothetical protein
VCAQLLASDTLRYNVVAGCLAQNMVNKASADPSGMFGDIVHWLYQVLTAIFLVVYVRMPSGEWEGCVRQVFWVFLKSKTVLSAWDTVVRAELRGLDIPLDDRGTWVARVDPVLVVCNLASEAVRSV